MKIFLPSGALYRPPGSKMAKSTWKPSHGPSGGVFGGCKEARNTVPGATGVMLVRFCVFGQMAIPASREQVSQKVFEN
jgi:hypothetical protein